MLDLSYSGSPMLFWDGRHMGLAQLTVTDGSVFLSWVKDPIAPPEKLNRIFTGFTGHIGVCVRDLVLLRPDLTVEETNTLDWFGRTKAAPSERVPAEVYFVDSDARWFCPTCRWPYLVYRADPHRREPRRPSIQVLNLTPSEPGDIWNYTSDVDCVCCKQQWKLSFSGGVRIAEICHDRKNIWWKRC